MKATGIVRRIDDLGRVVIPKEIRRTMRIREGDPLEIYTNVDGEVIFKKYSPIGEISSIASQYAEVLSKIGGCPAAICDRDHIIAVSGMQKKEVLERRVSGSLEDLIEQRKSHVYRCLRPQYLPGGRKRCRDDAGRRRYRICQSRADGIGAGSGNVLFQADGGVKTVYRNLL